MLAKLGEFFSNSEFMPHGHCYLWQPPLVWTMFTSDLLIGTAYVSISATLYTLVRRARLPFSAVFVAFGVFILACGATHFMEILTLWHPNYWAAAGVKVVTALASVATAIWLFPLFPKAIALTKTNETLQRSQADLKRSHENLEKRVEERTSELSSAVHARDEFLSIASHELKTPLTALNLQLQTISRNLERAFRAGDDSEGKALRERITRMIGGCESQSERLARLLEELLDLTRIRVGKLQLNREEVDLAQTTVEVIERLRQAAAQTGVAIEFVNRGPVVGNWDRTRIEQVVTNLLSNAIKYGNGKPVRVETTRNGACAVLKVRDQGLGIPENLQTRIFERFERATSSEQITGLGLGLYIVRQIVEAHRGKVHVESKEGQGSLFSVELPIE